jgi:integrase
MWISKLYYDEKQNSNYFQFINDDSKRKQTVRCSKDKKEALKIWHEFCFKNGYNTAKSVLFSCDEVLKVFLEHAEIAYAKGTYSNYYGYYEHHLQELVKKNLKDLTKPYVKNWYDRTRSDLSPHVFNGVLKLVKASFNYAIDSDMITVNPFVRLKPIKIPKKHRNRFSTAKLKEILKYVKKEMPDFYLLFIFACCSGMRAGEYVALKYEDIEESTIKVERQFTKGEIKEPKTRLSTRRVGKGKFVSDAIEWHCHKYNIKSGWLFPSPVREDTPITAQVPDRRFKHLLIKLGFDEKYMRLHDLRGQYIDIQHNAGTPTPEISREVGHSNTRTTTEIYTEILSETRQKAIEAIDKTFLLDD